ALSDKRSVQNRSPTCKIKKTLNILYVLFTMCILCILFSGVSIRLAGSGATQCSGRVEIYYNNIWGTVYGDGWDLNEAEVVCRQLNCGTAIQAPLSSYRSPGAYQIWLYNLACSGSESSLTQCHYTGWGMYNNNNNYYNYYYYYDAGVICSDLIRLTGSGSTRCSGRVEVYHNNSWGTVCDDGWDLNDAAVVCRQLNCGSALEVPQSAQFGAGTGQICLDNVGCSGNESSLIECNGSGFGTYSCGNHHDADVICSGKKAFRLAGSGLTRCSGRVEIYYNNIWGTVCDDYWDLKDAQVVCRQINCGTALEAPRSALFGAGTGQIWLDNVGCSGNESSLIECKYNQFGTNNCGHQQDAGVICSGTGQIWLDNVTCSGGESSPTECQHSGFGTNNCGHGQDAGVICSGEKITYYQVVCRQLNCGSALGVPRSAHFGAGTGQIWLDHVTCSGSEGSLTQCQHGGFGTNNCVHNQDAGVICSDLIRLVGSGSTRCSGRVEIFHNNSWGTVCDDNWDLNDAQVVCRELNCGTALGAPPFAQFGAGTGQIWLDNVTCSGNENSLTECQAKDERKLQSVPIRLTGSGLTRCSGRVEVFYNNIWGTVCDNGWDVNDAQVVCRQLNCGTALQALPSAYFGAGTGQIWFSYMTCSGNENSLTECQHSGFGTNNCGHQQDAGVFCSGVRKTLDHPQNVKNGNYSYFIASSYISLGKSFCL
uniref:SRCR domain-containing protein n=1 Tax=Neolamprologus brichardi TaxID=32507 RepID=A0A3Q4HP17_NEOBR